MFVVGAGRIRALSSRDENPPVFARGCFLHRTAHANTSLEYRRFLVGLSSQPTLKCGATADATLEAWRVRRHGHYSSPRQRAIRATVPSRPCDALHSAASVSHPDASQNDT
jgi:hypothetical protein